VGCVLLSATKLHKAVAALLSPSWCQSPPPAPQPPPPDRSPQPPPQPQRPPPPHSGSVIRKNTSHHQGYHCARPARLQPQRAAAPRRARKGLPPSRLGEDTRRPSSSPQRTSRGAMGGLARRASGTLPHKTRPKNGKGPQVYRAIRCPPFSVRCPLHRGAVWLSQVGLGVLGFRSPTSREIRGAGRRGSGERGCSPPVLLCG
jgi:hypothetical protein